jgi:hypothetical protein
MIQTEIFNLWNAGLSGKSLIFLIICAVTAGGAVLIFLIYKTVDYYLGEKKKGYAIIIDKYAKDVEKTSLQPCVPVETIPVTDKLLELKLKVKNEDGICEVRIENDYFAKAKIGQKVLITYTIGYISKNLYIRNIHQ